VSAAVGVWAPVIVITILFLRSLRRLVSRRYRQASRAIKSERAKWK
jgi:hypothetical protein